MQPTPQAAALLLECHGRIRSFLATARRVAEAVDPPPGELAEAARAVHRYFTEALPLHAEDEEASLLPRLRGREPALDEALAVMAAEHQEHRARVAELTEACASLAAAPTLHPLLAPGLLGAVSWLERHFEAHLAAEEARVFPAMARWLDPAEDAAFVAELRARRAGAAPRTQAEPFPARGREAR